MSKNDSITALSLGLAGADIDCVNPCSITAFSLKSFVYKT